MSSTTRKASYMPEIQTTLELLTGEEMLLNRIEALMAAVRLLHPLLDLLEASKTDAPSGATGDLAEILHSIYTTTIETAAMVQQIDARTQDLSQEIAAIRKALQIQIS
jgi:hypothetical protein